jgi:hypothetical protein
MAKKSRIGWIDGSNPEALTTKEQSFDPSSDPSSNKDQGMDQKNEPSIHRSIDPTDFLFSPDSPENDKNSPSMDRDPSQIQKGDRVIPQGKARWIRKGSQPLPRHLIPKGLSEAEEIVLGAIDGALFHDLTSVSRVIEVSADGQRAKVMSAGGRKSVFPIEDLSKLDPQLELLEETPCP